MIKLSDDEKTVLAFLIQREIKGTPCIGMASAKELKYLANAYSKGLNKLDCIKKKLEDKNLIYQNYPIDYYHINADMVKQTELAWMLSFA